jgi:hypothetical protein
MVQVSSYHIPFYLMRRASGTLRALVLYKDKRFYEDWGGRAGLSLMLRVDEHKSWPLVEEIMSGNESFYSFVVFREIYPHLNASHKQQIIDYYLDRPASLSSWDLPKMLDAVSSGPFDRDTFLKASNRFDECRRA